MTKQLNIGMVGYGFMARAHSNAWANVSHFFDTGYRPVLKRPRRAMSQSSGTSPSNGGYESQEGDWRHMVERKDIDAIDICVPNDLHAEIAIAAAKGRQDGAVRKAAGPDRGRRQADGGTRSRRPASPTWSGTIIAACRQ